jgi:endonuclease YncB( thermonuclease family)
VQIEKASMKTRSLTLALVVLAVGCAGLPRTHPDVVVCTRVIDGDTIVVRWHEQIESVRLTDLDAPEIRRGARLRAQALVAGVSEDAMLARGKAARDALGAALTGRRVRLIWTEGYAARDRWGRLLARVERVE